MVKGRQSVRLPQRRKPDVPSSPESEAPKLEADKPLSSDNIQKVLLQVLPLLTLAALVSPVSQATLAPVYGSISSNVNHAEAITATILLGFIGRHLWRNWVGDFSIQPYLALWAFWMPALQAYLFGYSGKWGPVLGAIITGFVSCHSFTMPSAYAAAHALEGLGLQEQLGDIAGVALPAIILDLAYFRPMEYAFSHLLPRLTTSSTLFSPPKLQYLLATLYALLSPSKPYWLATLGIPALLHGLLANPHLDISPRNLEVLNRDLAPHNWTVLARQWSITGYLSVIEGSVDQYRALRCDHSLLGGEWLLTDQKRKEEGWQVPESIYAIFHILEAVRLVEVSPVIRDSDAHALVVGLGIGTAPKALIANGITTTILELDPVVHAFATQYFGLPTEHTAILSDAVAWVAAQTTSNPNTNPAPNGNASQQYDYIIHDVFTGGAEPLPLFTDTFLSGLRSLLTPNGVVAINYAGDLRLDITRRVLNTIYQTFDGQCRVFGDAAPASNGPTPDGSDGEAAFLNLAVFCRNSPGSIAFRKAVRADWLGSRNREQFLLPREEYEIAFPYSLSSEKTESGGGGGGDGGANEGKEMILRQGEEGLWRRQQEESAIKHWQIMRRVLPDAVWEMW
ncbi:hypothetical protein LTR35_017408 [Friedmanniomyces endolithicus]|uniref:PABS domain-containing protein n=1 Tax=Friedmanniomyces endolithicus TaxID=329885 RepID=A0AAN6FIM1_9PEZI|nr:hypothetical protein LTR35_017408 [Friedmanniomyces endolithicus]KAK0270065.1 hypothetical protein LTS00_017086 [Friedmanniomyces endolithicus]KAK0316862.1 hypothetical protein LTR82_012004 [Friedmanniomyces endolithicus]